MAAKSDLPKSLNFYLVLDFEATCDDKNPPKPQEIIEFPVVMVNARTMRTDSVFHTYVRPTVHPQLTPFCIQLTGIKQDMLIGQPTLAEALDKFDAWYKANGLFDPAVSSSFVTCGDWDLKTMLPNQCRHFKISRPGYFDKWVNIKKLFETSTGVKAKGMPFMLRHFDLELEGRHHSGIDDSKNIARILTKLVQMYPHIHSTASIAYLT